MINGLPGDPVDEVVAAIVAEGGQAIPFAGDISAEGRAMT